MTLGSAPGQHNAKCHKKQPCSVVPFTTLLQFTKERLTYIIRKSPNKFMVGENIQKKIKYSTLVKYTILIKSCFSAFSPEKIQIVMPQVMWNVLLLSNNLLVLLLGT